MGCFDLEEMWGVHEECGVFGIYNPAGDCARDTYYGLYALQHRGQESCGIAANNHRDITCYKDMGMVGEVFSEEKLDELNGTMAVGHVRYSTAGGSKRENAQPLTLNYIKNNLALVHNGNLVNANALKREFELKGSIFQTTADTEVIAYAIARQRLECKSIEEAVLKATRQLVGAFSLIVMSGEKLIAARDPWGFRPLCIGRKGDAIYFSSESCGLDSVGAEYIREVDPGEIVVVDKDGMRSDRTHVGEAEKASCVFEYIYFARPDSEIFGQSVHLARRNAGRLLAQEHAVEADLVIGVPDSGLDAALGYAQAGKQVTILEALPDILSAGIPVPEMNDSMLRDLLDEAGVVRRTGRRLSRVTEDGAVADGPDGEEKLPADHIVLAVGFAPRTSLAPELAGAGMEVYQVGDGSRVGSVMTAIGSAYTVGRML